MTRDELIIEHIPLVRGLVMTLFRNAPFHEFEDRIGDGMIGLIYAADHFKPEMGVSFRTYAWHCVLGSVRRWNKRRDHLSRWHRKQVREGRMQAPVQVRLTDVMLERAHEDALVTRPDEDTRIDVQRAMRMLDPREQRLIRDVYWHERPVKDCATDLGVKTRGGASQAHRAALKQLRGSLQAYRGVA